MKKSHLLMGLAAIVACAAMFFVYQSVNKNKTVAANVDQTVVREDLEFAFTYPSGEGALSLVEPPVSQETGLMQAYLLFPTDAYIDFQQSEEPREAPASISVFVFEMGSTTDKESGRITRLQNWASDRASLTSYNLALNTPDILELDGVKAIHYQADGLYPQEVYLASYGGRVYMFVGQYLEAGDYLDTTFDQVIASVTFY